LLGPISAPIGPPGSGGGGSGGGGDGGGGGFSGGGGGGGAGGGSCGCGGGGGPIGGGPIGNWPPVLDGNEYRAGSFPIFYVSYLGGDEDAGRRTYILPFGGANDALHRAAAMPSIARSRAIPQVSLSTGACGSLGGNCTLNPANGNLLLQAYPPAGDAFYLPPMLSYNSTSASTSSEFGNGWSSLFSRFVSLAGSFQLTVQTGAGNVAYYNANAWSGGYYPPLTAQPTSPNSLYSATQFTAPFIETQPDGLQFQYAGASSPWRLQSIINPAGARWTLTRDGSNRVTQVADPISRLTTLSYDGTSGKITRIQDPFGRITTLSVTASGNLAQITSPELCIFSLACDSSNRPTAWINPLGDRTSYSFDGSNRVTSATSPLRQVTSLTYNTNQTLVTNPRGYVTTLNFNSGGTLASAIDATGILTTYSWDNSNRLTAIVDGLGNPTSLAYGTLSNQNAGLASITQPLGGIFTYTYSGNQVAAVTDQLGNTTSLVWNSAGYRIAAIDPQSNRTSYSYSSGGLLTAVQNPLGQIVSMVYNAVGQQIALINPIGQAVSFTYNANGLVQTIQNPLGAITTYLRDQVNRLTNFVDPLGNTFNYAYDANSRLTQTTNPVGAVWSLSYDQNGRLVSSTDPLNNVTSYGFDSAGNWVSTTDPLGNIRTAVYDYACACCSPCRRGQLVCGPGKLVDCRATGNCAEAFEGSRLRSLSRSGLGRLAA